MPRLSAKQIEDLWVQQGGDPKAAPLMAAIAIAESGGRTDAVNNNPSTGDFSVGLWQINYYQSLGPARTARYGSWQDLSLGPNAAELNAKAAINLYAGGRGLRNWQGDAAYKAYADGGLGALSGFLQGAPTPDPLQGDQHQAPPRPSGTQDVGLFSGIEGAFGDASGFLGGLWGGITGTASALKALVGLMLVLFNPRNWLRAFEAIVGFWMIMFGLYFFGKNEGQADVDVGSLLRRPDKLARGASGGAGQVGRRAASGSLAGRTATKVAKVAK